jgi:tetratricopeptide (TPR) repeat protein
VVLAQEGFPNAVHIVAPNGVSTKVLARPDPNAEVIDTVLQGDILERVGEKGKYIEVRLPDKKTTGFVLKAHTESWEPPKETGSYLWIAVLVFLVAAVAIGVWIFFSRAKRAKELEEQAAEISRSIRDGEEFFRSGDFEAAITQFKRHVELQEGEVRNPDVYRRMAICYKETDDAESAAVCWEKMNALGGVKTTEDYALGVEIMTAQGKYAEAAQIYEELLEKETDEDRRYDIRKKLIDLYRRLKASHKLMTHANEILSEGSAEPQILNDTVNYLMAREETELAIEFKNKEIIQRICEEFLEENNRSIEAEQIYVKCLEYNPKDQRIHHTLAEKYQKEGDFRKAVSELTILHQIDKSRSDEYVEEAAKLYVENKRVTDALAEGNPKIIKKIAQIYLARSQVNDDAVAVYEKVLEWQPKAVGVNKLLSTVYLTRGDLQNYMTKLRLLHEIDGRNHDYLTDLARCVVDNDLVEKTMREGNRELNTKILKQLIKKQAHDDNAVAIFERLLKHEPDNPVIRNALAAAYEKRGESAKALEHLLTLDRLKRDDRGVARRAANIAIANDLLETIADRGTGQVLDVTAEELVKANVDNEAARRILEKAGKQRTGETTMRLQPGKLRKPSAPKPEPRAAASSQQAAAPPREPARPGPAPETKRRPAAPPQQPSPPVKAKEPLAPTPKNRASQVVPPQRRPKAAIKKEPEPAPEPKPPSTAEEQAPESGKFIEVPRHETLASSSHSEVSTFVSLHEKAAQEISAEQDQVVKYTVSSEIPSHGQVTTFVSGYEKGGGGVRWREEELYRPNAGGLAYAAVRSIGKDGWGEWRAGVEVNRRRDVVMRLFEVGLMRSVILESQAMDEFLLEVSQLAVNMAHENILDVEEVVTGPGGRKGIVYSFLPQTLESLLNAKHPPGLGVMIPLALQLVEALAYTSNYKGLDGMFRNSYHLHLQPTQILVSEDLKVCKVAGFGFLDSYRRISNSTGPRFEDPGMNPAYMAPEFFRAKGVTSAGEPADIYSLGAILYHMVTGVPPFDGPLFADYKFQHTGILPAPPRLVNSSVPAWLEPIILVCLEKDPAKRWNSLAELRQTLKREIRKGN